MDNDKNTDKDEISRQHFGKFASAEELLAAYNALESEFTKRCQLVKELQARIDSDAQAQAAIRQECTARDDDRTPSEEPSANVDVPENSATVEPSAEAQTASVAPADVIGAVIADVEEYLDALCAVPQVMDECVARYKQALLCKEFGMPQVRGSAVLTPIARPKTLVDAKRIADGMLKR